MKKILILISIMLFSCNNKPTTDQVSKDHTAKLNKFVEKLETITDWSQTSFGGHCWIETNINETSVYIFDDAAVLIDMDAVEMPTPLQERILKIYNKYNKHVNCLKTDPLDEVLK